MKERVKEKQKWMQRKEKRTKEIKVIEKNEEKVRKQERKN